MHGTIRSHLPYDTQKNMNACLVSIPFSLSPSSLCALFGTELQCSLQSFSLVYFASMSVIQKIAIREALVNKPKRKLFIGSIEYIDSTNISRFANFRFLQIELGCVLVGKLSCKRPEPVNARKTFHIIGFYRSQSKLDMFNIAVTEPFIIFRISDCF